MARSKKTTETTGKPVCNSLEVDKVRKLFIRAGERHNPVLSGTDEQIIAAGKRRGWLK